MQQLIEKFSNMAKLEGDAGFVGRSGLGIIEKNNLLELEKSQINEAYVSGAELGLSRYSEAEAYFNKTFTK